MKPTYLIKLVNCKICSLSRLKKVCNFRKKLLFFRSNQTTCRKSSSNTPIKSIDFFQNKRKFYIISLNYLKSCFLNSTITHQYCISYADCQLEKCTAVYHVVKVDYSANLAEIFVACENIVFVEIPLNY